MFNNFSYYYISCFKYLFLDYNFGVSVKLFLVLFAPLVGTLSIHACAMALKIRTAALTYSYFFTVSGISSYLKKGL